jgi:hypothetical protein
MCSTGFLNGLCCRGSDTDDIKAASLKPCGYVTGDNVFILDDKY